MGARFMTLVLVLSACRGKSLLPDHVALTPPADKEVNKPGWIVGLCRSWSIEPPNRGRI